MLTKDYITEVFCLIDGMMKKNEKSLRSRVPAPKLSDAEVITMEIAGELPGMDCDKIIHQYFRDHWKPLFPTPGESANLEMNAQKLYISAHSSKEP